MREPPQNRRMDDLHPLFRDPLERWLAAARAAGFDILVYETFRTPARQQWLYDAGRSRKPLGRFLTYTLDSCHRYGIAADLVPLRQDKSADWDGYAALYRKVPPTDFGLEKLDFEQPHLQLIGGQDRARALGILRDVIVGSGTGKGPASLSAGTPLRVKRLFVDSLEQSAEIETATVQGDKLYIRTVKEK